MRAFTRLRLLLRLFHVSRTWMVLTNPKSIIPTFYSRSCRSFHHLRGFPFFNNLESNICLSNSLNCNNNNIIKFKSLEILMKRNLSIINGITNSVRIYYKKMLYYYFL